MDCDQTIRDRELVRARLRAAERRLALIRSELDLDQPKTAVITHAAYWAGRELAALTEAAR